LLVLACGQEDLWWAFGREIVSNDRREEQNPEGVGRWRRWRTRPPLGAVVGGGEPVAWGGTGAVVANMAAKAAVNCCQEVEDCGQEG
jgi:hypothetical protein